MVDSPLPFLPGSEKIPPHGKKADTTHPHGGTISGSRGGAATKRRFASTRTAAVSKTRRQWASHAGRIGRTCGTVAFHDSELAGQIPVGRCARFAGTGRFAGPRESAGPPPDSKATGGCSEVGPDQNGGGRCGVAGKAARSETRAQVGLLLAACPGFHLQAEARSFPSFQRARIRFPVGWLHGASIPFSTRTGASSISRPWSSLICSICSGNFFH